MSSNILAITGMHRSGTSLLSEYINACGLNVGEHLYDGGTLADNSKAGHHEDEEFISLHKSILGTTRTLFGQKRVSVFITQKKQIPLPSRPTDYERAHQLIDAREKYSQWGWKDPRTTLFLNFWADIDETIRFAFIYRDPLEVVDSVLRRGDDIDVVKRPKLALQTWLLYNQNILDFAKKYPHRCLVVGIEDFTQNPQLVVECLNRKLKFELKAANFKDVFASGSYKKSLSATTQKLATRQKRLLESCYMLQSELEAQAIEMNGCLSSV